MINLRIGTSVIYTGNQGLPASRQIEIAEEDPLSKENPNTQIVEGEPYLPSKKLVDVINLAIALGRPLLLQGDPGCGKTRLAYAVAYELGLPLEECYIKSTSRAQDLLYTYDAVSRLYDAQLGENTPKDKDGNPFARDVRNYIRLGPLGRAIARAQYGRRSVVLIDEIDKADLDFPNDLLWELDRLEFRVEEARDLHYSVGDRPELWPIFIITHNEEKALPAAFLRRCIFHYVEFPQSEAEVEQILALHAIKHKALRQEAIKVIQQLRALELSKKPGLSELIDWVGYLEAIQTPPEELHKLPYIGALLKQQDDQQRVAKDFSKSD